jgi:hypothetical protein
MSAEQPGRGDVLVLVGTRKGSFLFWSDEARREWHRRPMHGGWMVHHMSFDGRDQSLLAATNREAFGGRVQRSTDFGLTWPSRSEKLDYPADSPYRVRKVWHVLAGAPQPPARVYAGAERAGLFQSDDHGETWAAVNGLLGHPTAAQWQPGKGGLCLHSIVLDPNDPRRLYVGISAVGVLRTDDGGQTWTPKNQGVRADFLADPYPEFGQCVHKVRLHPARPDVLYQQNHCGVYRSDDRGDRWVDISEGLPSRFGFPLAIHAYDPDTIYVVPHDDGRLVPEGRMTVWRSRDRGASWKPLTRGLPDRAYLTVLREALDADSADRCGIYLGTETGQLFFSRDEGDSWEILADLLPPVYSVSTGRVG